MFKTSITEMLGIEYPIIQGGMQWIANAEFAAAVSNAGGLGIIASGSFEAPDQLRQEIRKAHQLTQKPLGINITLIPAVRPRDYPAFIRVALEEGVRIFETAGANPGSLLELLKSDGGKVIHKTPAVRFARSAQKEGVDAVVILGQGAAGHPGMDLVSSMVLVPAAVDALDIPVIAGGEIADGRGLVAALALGAQGVLMGTRFMATQEAQMHPKVKQWLLDASETDTVLIQKSIRNTARMRANDIAYKVLGLESQNAKLEDLLPYISGINGKRLQEEGDLNAGVLACGQAVGLIHDLPTIKDLIDSIIREARQTVKRIGSI